ncbi:cytochrome c oxidase subunit 3 [Pontibacter sp. JH31]|uniref:Cytochrome c oxidase subunit 3 n=1 Tax=Pontibacter aquaedesilientis TaxID=2766980 RepID=A0ABR7XHP0_9BACT|nr:cytochrome c oxidase subunit 3 [Pontibacter aquaedesilientis]MBD1397819.1 cytochrome c oxidase subunit 3 [Pontibacter aquaedesilientis]
MDMVAKSLGEENNTAGVHPLKFTLWLIIISIIMMFAAFTSAYLVRRAEGNWLEFDLPNILLINTVIIALSSVTMQMAHNAAASDNISRMRLLLYLTFGLGITFLIGQWNGWSELVSNNVFFGGETSNPSGSFMYVLTGVHAFHIITGLLYLAFVITASIRYKVHSKSMLRIQLCTIYWHFLGGLWLYLYIFLRLNH